ncbi:MAG: hypothetical protein JXB07_04635 [Anaerolineae bacterium]|nr:hypothetical protein [Anaerolineae bacterium]
MLPDLKGHALRSVSFSFFRMHSHVAAFRLSLSRALTTQPAQDSKDRQAADKVATVLLDTYTRQQERLHGRKAKHGRKTA